MHKSINIYYSWNISIFWRQDWSQSRFFDISKVFDKLWHEGLICKLKQNREKDNLQDTLTNFLNDGKQRVVLNSQPSKWANIKVGGPQGLVLWPLLFL